MLKKGVCVNMYLISGYNRKQKRKTNKDRKNDDLTKKINKRIEQETIASLQAAESGVLKVVTKDKRLTPATSRKKALRDIKKTKN